MACLEGGNGEKPTYPDAISEMVAITRYNTNCRLGATFGSGGVPLLNNASTFQGISQFALLSNGDYLIVSSSGPL